MDYTHKVSLAGLFMPEGGGPLKKIGLHQINQTMDAKETIRIGEKIFSLIDAGIYEETERAVHTRYVHR